MNFFLSKFLWYIFNPFNFFIFLFLFCFILFFFKKNKIIFYLIIFNFFIIFLVSLFPIGDFLIYKLEKNFHDSYNQYPDKVEGILILGGTTNAHLSNEYNQVIVNESAERLIESILLIRKYNEATIIFSGGLGHSEVAKKFYYKMGIDLKKIIFEDRSRNTYENILFSKEILNFNQKEDWILITSAFHMRRATLIAEKVNWTFHPFPVDFNQPKELQFSPNLNLLYNITAFQKASHEWIGLVAYYLMGRTDKIF